MDDKWLAGIAVVAAALMASCGSEPRIGVPMWAGHLTITLPPSLATSATAGEACSGRAGTMWSDIRSNALVRIRTEAGRELAHWTLPAGTAHTTVDGRRTPRGCSFVLSAADGIPIQRAYQLVVGGHTLRIPGRKLLGDAFVVLPDRVFSMRIPVS